MVLSVKVGGASVEEALADAPRQRASAPMVATLDT